jgi:hypothetical protein
LAAKLALDDRCLILVTALVVGDAALAHVCFMQAASMVRCEMKIPGTAATGQGLKGSG